MTDKDNKIKVFGSDDDLKSLGELLSNETSRRIIKNLMEHEMYTNEIATKLDMRVSLVIHHLKKMQALGLLEITDKKIKRKGEKHRFFKMDFDIFVAFDKTKDEVKEKGILKIFFKDRIKIVAIGIVGLSSWFGTERIQLKLPPPDLFYEEPMIHIPITMLWSILFTGIFVSISIFLLRLKKRKKG